MEWTAWVIQPRVSKFDSCIPKIMQNSWGELELLNTHENHFKIQSQVQLRPFFQCKTKYSTYVSACVFHTLFFTLPLKKLIFSLSFCTLLFFLYFMRPQPELNLDCWVTERLAVKGREERRERWRRKNSAGGGHRRSFSPRSLFSWHTTARLPQRPCFPSEYSPSLPPL